MYNYKVLEGIRLLSEENWDKEASSASLLRHVLRLLKQGKPVPWDISDKLLKKTQATAEKQYKYFQNNLPFYRRPNDNWDSTWGRTGNSLYTLDGHQIRAKDHAAGLGTWPDTIAKSRQSSPWQKFRKSDKHSIIDRLRDALGKDRELQNKMLNEIIEAQNDLRYAGQDIGRFRGTIAPRKFTLPDAPLDDGTSAWLPK